MSALHLLVLLGFICQAWTWDEYILPAASILLWIGCLILRRKQVHLSVPWEGAILVLGCAAAFGVAAALRQNTHFFIGHGLTLLQAVRLMRTLNRREQIVSLLIACLQIAVGCAAILDYRIVLILFAAVSAFPRALLEITAEQFTVSPGARPRLARGTLPIVVTSMVLFFLLFPRAFLTSPFQARAYQRGSDGTLADYILDPSRSSSHLSSRVILQVEGNDVGYLRYFALTDYDGLRWTGPRSPGVGRIEYVPRNQVNRYPHRRVHVKQVNVLGRVLPTDGRVVQLDGKFFRRPLRNAYEIIECDALWHTRNNVYDYWIDPRPRAEALSPGLRRRYLQIPPPSPRLRNWLADTVAGIDDPKQQARKLEEWLRTNLRYEIGTPELNRLNPIDDFIFHQKEGHCERFAAALAVLLRMQGIPSRIIIGYAPGSRNWFSGRYNIRFKDAHAWTEAHFPDLGWQQLDGTPRASMPPDSSTVSDLLETLDFFWYSNIVNFDVPTQRQMFSKALGWVARLPSWAHRHQLGLVGLLLLLMTWLAWRNHRLSGGRSRASRRAAVTLASHHYGRMSRVLARQGFLRDPSQSPFEFVGELKKAAYPQIEAVNSITALFCLARYGRHSLSAAQEQELDAALETLTGKGREKMVVPRNIKKGG